MEQVVFEVAAAGKTGVFGWTNRLRLNTKTFPWGDTPHVFPSSRLWDRGRLPGNMSAQPQDLRQQCFPATGNKSAARFRVPENVKTGMICLLLAISTSCAVMEQDRTPSETPDSAPCFRFLHLIDEIHTAMRDKFFAEGFGVDYKGSLTRGWREATGWRAPDQPCMWSVGKMRPTNDDERPIIAGGYTTDPIGAILLLEGRTGEVVVDESGFLFSFKVDVSDPATRSQVVRLLQDAVLMRGPPKNAGKGQ